MPTKIAKKPKRQVPKTDDMKWDEIDRSWDRLEERNRRFLKKLGPGGMLDHLRKRARRKTHNTSDEHSLYEGDPWRVLSLMARNDVTKLCRTGGCDIVAAVKDLPGLILASYIGKDAIRCYIDNLLICIWPHITLRQHTAIAAKLRDACRLTKRYSLEPGECPLLVGTRG